MNQTNVTSVDAVIIDDSYPLEKQPIDIKIELKTHQLALLKKCSELEQSSNSPIIIPKGGNSTIELKSKFGIMGDIVGSGKTISMLSLIANNPVLNNSLSMISMKSNLVSFVEHSDTLEADIIATNIIVVPHTIYKQWCETIEKYTTLTYYGINNSKSMLKFIDIFNDTKNDGSYLTFNKQIILISNTRFNDYMNISIKHWNSINMVSRYIFDEADILKISYLNKDKIKASFIWFVTSSYKTLLSPYSRTVWVNNYGDISYVYNSEYSIRTSIEGLRHGGFIKNTMIDITNYRDYYKKHLVLKNDDTFVRKSFDLPDYILNQIKCKTPHYLNILDKSASQEIINHLQAGDIKGAIEKLDCKTFNEKDLISGITDKLNIKLKNLHLEFKMKMEMTWSSEKAKTEGMKLIKNKIADTTQKIQSIEDKLKSSNMCVICYDDLKTTSVAPCCNTKFCLECISQWLIHNKSCPFCRQQNMDLNSMIVVSTIVKKVEALSSKIDNLRIIIDKEIKNPRFKMLIFSDYNNSFDKIEALLSNYSINYANVNGTTHTINKKLRLYKEYDSKDKIDVLLLNANYCANGINLENSTDIVLYHSMNKEKTTQIIGRGQRPGREESLNVWKLCYSNEIGL